MVRFFVGLVSRSGGLLREESKASVRALLLFVQAFPKKSKAGFRFLCGRRACFVRIGKGSEKVKRDLSTSLSRQSLSQIRAGGSICYH